MLEGKPPTTGPRDMQVDPRDHAELQKRLKLLTDLTDHLRAVRQEVSLKTHTLNMWHTS